MKRILLLLAMLIWGAPAWAAPDANGYTALYEARAGNPNFDVDVAGLQALSCDQTITTATTPTGDWSAITWTNRVICVQAGDHSGRGVLSLDASGTAGTRKVIRGVTSGGANLGDAWNPAGGTAARIHALHSNNQDYILIDGIEIDPNNTNFQNGVHIVSGSVEIILNRVLVENVKEEMVLIVGSTKSGIQNSVIRYAFVPSGGAEYQCVSAGEGGLNNFAVNNEIYGCNKYLHTWSGTTNPGFKFENNDNYVPDDRRTDCAGNFTPTGTCGDSEGFSIKSGGTAANPVIILHNRFWNAFDADGDLIQVGDGVCTSISNEGGGSGADYVLVLNNICGPNAENGFWNFYGGPDHISYIGNIAWDVRDINSSGDEASGFRYRGLAEGSSGNFSNVEFYLNTVIKADVWLGLGDGTDNDVRCNVVIDSGARTGTPGSGFQQDHQVYYGTTDSGETNKITNALNTRDNSTEYSLNAIMRTGAIGGCSAGTESACFLYKATVAGTSAASPPTPCVTTGCTYADGTVPWKMIRGPYIFKRKLRTVAAGETVAIPYARPLYGSALPEFLSCPSGSESGAVGGRTGIGINDVKPPNPPFDTDLMGKSR
jgi:hypothetical protein